MLERLDPPGFLSDFDRIEGQREQWSAAVSGWIDECIDLISNATDPPLQPQLYNPLRTEVSGPLWEQAIVWNALPGVLRNRYGRRLALELAEHPRPLTVGPTNGYGYQDPGQWSSLLYRPQDEYCEWRTERDAATGNITSVTFTSEPPEYWQALHGGTLSDLRGRPAHPMRGDPALVLQLYRELVDPRVQPEDLVFPADFRDISGNVYPRGGYNPWNRWNTRDGIMHLTHPQNSLTAEIQLAAAASLLRGQGSDRVTDPEALICCGLFGDPDRLSDPTIGSSVNQLALLGLRLTLRNPVGLCMTHLDLSGFAKPDGSPVGPEYFEVQRGDASRRLIERARFRVPEGEGFTVSDLTIAGVPITWGSEIAERITVGLVACAAEPGAVSNGPLPCRGRCCQMTDAPQALLGSGLLRPCPPGTRAAFTSAAPALPAVAPAPAAAAGPAPPGLRGRTPVGIE